jgi:hypothetical protein
MQMPKCSPPSRSSQAAMRAGFSIAGRIAANVKTDVVMKRKSKDKTLRDLLEELQHEVANVKARLDALERPKIARVILPARTEPGGDPRR